MRILSVITVFLGLSSLVAQTPSDSSNLMDTVNVKSVKLRQLNDMLSDIDGMGIYASKKNEIINIKKLNTNLATGIGRIAFASIPGLNIWENDGAGIQLSIGSRGLDPNRTSNFNTRQNYYDISADPLGYPESYYTPALENVERIELIRGAASLQYGPQFGGLLNFKLKDGSRATEAVQINQVLSIGSKGFFSNFTSLQGKKGRWNYYASFKYKKGDGWRDNSQFSQNNLYGSITYRPKASWKIKLDLTHMNYLTQMPGGLVDFEFYRNPVRSIRNRNWFSVDWNLMSLQMHKTISKYTSIQNISYGLYANRKALGELGPINRPDPLSDRNLVEGKYRNFGNETRLLHKYVVQNKPSALLLGLRYYQGNTHNVQDFASAGSDANFSFKNPGNAAFSDYRFPNRNISLFAENLFRLSSKFSLTPGLRYEYISTSSNGFYKERVISGGQVLQENKYKDSDSRVRGVVLMGIGGSYFVGKSSELYANISTNYRSITFNDLIVVNPNLLIDDELEDERGSNIDLGYRSKLWKNRIRIDASLFCLHYQNRIGLGELLIQDSITGPRVASYRTNIGASQSIGLELGAQLHIPLNRKKDIWFNSFTSSHFIQAKYISGASNIKGNFIESVPAISSKIGLGLEGKYWQFSHTFSWVGEQFSDATNATITSDATRGIVPSYMVNDLSIKLNYKGFHVQYSMSNMLDAMYFTRRATAYPGPGILPADGRMHYVTMGFKF
jgi:Fe(3+) dicitrate transport protein